MKAHLTDAFVSRLKTPGTYYDKTTPAFGIRVGKNRKTWIVVRGRDRIRTRIGHYPAVSLADARKEAKKLLTELPGPKTPTLGEAYAKFKEAIQDLKPRTQRDYKRMIGKYLVPKFERKKLADITYDAIMKEMPEPPSEKAHALAVARTFFKWCVRPPRRYLEHSPLEGVEIKQGASRKRTLKAEEIRPVWNGARKQGYPHGIVVQLLLLTGQRRGEIANLRRPWINEKERTVTLPGWLTKNKKEHTFPYGNMAQKIFDRIPRFNSTDLLFPSRISQERPLSGWSKYKKELKTFTGPIENWTLHDLRRTHRSLHAEIGTPREIGERLINHVDAVTTDVEQIYDRYKYLPEMREAVTNYERRLSALVRPN